MSRRYGRNQRRRARERIKHLEDLLPPLSADREQWRRAALDAIQELREAKELAGVMSILFPAEIVKARHDERKTYEVPVIDVDSLDATLDAQATLSVLSLPVLLTRIDTDTLMGAKHVLVEYAGGTVGYAVPKQWVSRMHERHVIQAIGMNIVRHLRQTKR